MQPEISWNECRMINSFRRSIDAQPDLNSKVDYAVEHSPTTHGIPSTYVISYVGKVEWGQLASFIQGVFTLTMGHIMIEINATEENFCLSFQTVRKGSKYLEAFLKTLDEEGISYQVGDVEERKLPEVILPGRSILLLLYNHTLHSNTVAPCKIFSTSQGCICECEHKTLRVPNRGYAGL